MERESILRQSAFRDSRRVSLLRRYQGKIHRNFMKITADLWRRVRDSNPRDLSVYSISSLVRTWYFRVCRGRWRQFWKRRKPLCCNGFRTRRPVLTSSISEKTRVQIEMGSAPKRSFFCALARKYARRKPLSGMTLRTASPD